jgi:hypothetical protein
LFQRRQWLQLQKQQLVAVVMSQQLKNAFQALRLMQQRLTLQRQQQRLLK